MSSRPQSSECVVCGCSLGCNASTSHCTKCLLELGLNHEQPEISFSPRIFANYELLEQLGRGGMGVVYRARHVTTDRIVALKMLLHSQQDSPVAVLRFQIEGEAAARLSHPNIVRILEVGEHDGQCFISMPLIHGASLQERIERGEYRLANNESSAAAREWQTRVVELLLSVARAVEYAHSRGVLHRDLKPANILIDESETPYLTDFGLAKLTDSDLRPSETNASLGTPVYMSPEQTRGEPLNLTTDVYSLGVILYELLAGQLPFRAQTSFELAREISECEPLPPRRLNPTIDRGLQAISLKCLDKDTPRRYASAALLAEDLERYRSGQRVLARSPGLFRRGVRWTQNNRMPAALIGCLFAVLVAVLAAIYYSAESKKTAIELENERIRSEYAWNEMCQNTGIPTFWTNPDDRGAKFNSTLLHWAARIKQIDAPPRSAIEHCRIGMLVEEKDALAGLVSYAPLLDYLERKISNTSNTTRMDIHAYKKKESAIDALGRNEIDLLKIGGASFVVAVRSYPGIKPVVAQHPPKTGVIFVRRESGIADLFQLYGSKIALGDRYSTVSMWAAYRFAKLSVLPDYTRNAEPDGTMNQQVSRNTNKEPMDAVLSGDCEAGVINEKVLLKDDRYSQLMVLDKYESSPVLWLARSGLPAELIEAIKKALTELPDPAILDGLTDKVKSYKRVSTEEEAILHEVVTAVEVVTDPLR